MSIEKDNHQKLDTQINNLKKQLQDLVEQKLNYVQLEEYIEAVQTRDKEKEVFQELEKLKALKKSLIGTNEESIDDNAIE